MKMMSVQAISAYGSVMAMVSNRQMREPAEVHQEAAIRNLQLSMVESTLSTQKVKEVDKVPPKQRIKPDTHSPTHGIDVYI